MLAQVTYIQKFIMADSEDEFSCRLLLLQVSLLLQCLRGSAGRASGRRRPAGNIVRSPKLIFGANPAPTDIVFFSLDSTSLGPL